MAPPLLALFLTSFTKGGTPSFKFYVFSPDAAEEGRRRASLSGTVPEAHPSRKRLGLASSSWRRTEPSSFFVLDPRIAQLESLVSLYVRDEASRTPLKPWEKARWWWSESKERSHDGDVERSAFHVERIGDRVERGLGS